MNQKWTKSKVISEIKQLENKAAGFNDQNNSALYGAACRKFKSWKNAVETAGYNYDEIREIQEWTEDKTYNYSLF